MSAKSQENWHAIRVPRFLQNKIETLRDRMEVAYTEGRTDRFVQNDITGIIPLWQIINAAIEDYEHHLQRSSKRNVTSRS